MHCTATVLVLSIAATVSVAGCKRDPRAASVPTPPLPIGQVTSLPSQLVFSAFAQLHPNGLTHLAVDRIGNIYWSQESDDLHDVLFVSGVAMDVPRVTALSSDSILAALGAEGTRREGASTRTATGGTIQSIAVASGDAFDPNSESIYFYFTGGIGSDIRAALGRFDPASGAIRILADTRTLSRAAGMGASLALARGKLLFTERPATSRSGREPVMRLWLRHSDDSAVLEFNPTVDAAGNAQPLTFKRVLSTSIKVSDPPPTPDVLIPGVNDTPPSDRPVDLTRDESELCAAPPPRTRGSAPSDPPVDQLFLIDKQLGRLLRVDPAAERGAGLARTIASLVLLPEAVGEPTQLGDTTMFFVSDSNPLDPRFSDRPDQLNLQTTFPALLMVNVKGTVTAIDTNAMRGPSGFASHALKIRQLVPLDTDQWLAFDATSGQVMKVNGR